MTIINNTSKIHSSRSISHYKNSIPNNSNSVLMFSSKSIKAFKRDEKIKLALRKNYKQTMMHQQMTHHWSQVSKMSKTILIYYHKNRNTILMQSSSKSKKCKMKLDKLKILKKDFSTGKTAFSLPLIIRKVVFELPVKDNRNMKMKRSRISWVPVSFRNRNLEKQLKTRIAKMAVVSACSSCISR